MKPLTVYIMDGDKNHLPLATIMNSFDDYVEEFTLMPNRDLASAVDNCQTDWYMYLFDNETLSEGLRKALPILMESNFDGWVMLERQTNDEGQIVYGRSPRLFKRDIKLKGMVPLNVDELLVEKVLDGFLEQSQCKGSQ